MIKNLKNKKKKKAFTLIELIIVIAIIAILAAIAIPKFGDVKTKANLKADLANGKTIANAAATLITEESVTLPSSEKVYVISSNDKDSSIGDAIEGYLQSVPTPKSTGFTFYKVKVSTSGNVKVYMDNNSNENDTGAKELFPNPVTSID